MNILEDRILWMLVAVFAVSNCFVDAPLAKDRVHESAAKECQGVNDDLNDPWFHIQKANMYMDESKRKRKIDSKFVQDMKLSINECDEAIRLDPQLAASYATRAFANWHLSDTKAALHDFDEAIKIEPRATFYGSRGLLRNFDLADLNKCIELKPEAALYYKYRGNGKCLDKDFMGALNDYRESVRLDPASIWDCIEGSYRYSFISRTEAGPFFTRD